MAKIYRKSIQNNPNINDIFNGNLYEDEPDVLEIEVKEAIRHMSNRKALDCDAISVRVCEIAYGKQRYGQMTGRNQYMFLFIKRAIKRIWKLQKNHLNITCK